MAASPWLFRLELNPSGSNAWRRGALVVAAARGVVRAAARGVVRAAVPGAMIAGPASRASVIEFEAGHAHVSVTFALAAARCFVRPPVDLMRDDMVPLDELWGRSGGCLRERLLEALTPEDALSVMEDVLLRQMTGVLGPDPAVIAAARALSRGVPVGEVARDLGLLPRTLRRRFTRQVGLTPKRFARVQRMQRLVRDLDVQSEVDWAAAAARHGYADQPHLAGEFRELAGVTPAEYLRSRVDGPNHLRFPPGGLEPSAQAAPTLERRPTPRHYGAELSPGA